METVEGIQGFDIIDWTVRGQRPNFSHLHYMIFAAAWGYGSVSRILLGTDIEMVYVSRDIGRQFVILTCTTLCSSLLESVGGICYSIKWYCKWEKCASLNKTLYLCVQKVTLCDEKYTQNFNSETSLFLQRSNCVQSAHIACTCLQL
jgi:hypothetical protein